MKKVLKVVMATALIMSVTPTMLVPYAAVQQVPVRAETEADGSSMTSAQKIAPISVSTGDSRETAAGASSGTTTEQKAESKETIAAKAESAEAAKSTEAAAEKSTTAAAQKKTAAQVESPSTAEESSAASAKSSAASSQPASGKKTESEIVSAAAKSDYDNIAISQVSGYVNVRSAANTSSSVVGKLYNNAAADIVGKVNGEDGEWYQIKSGNVNGYTKAEYFITGSEAAKKASQIGTNVAKVSVSTKLNLRSEANTTSAVLDSLDPGSEYEVVGEDNGFYKIQVDNDLTGYVSKDYITLSTRFKTALTNSEDQKAADSAAKREQAAKAAISTLNDAHEESRAAETSAAAETTKAEAGTAAETKSSSKSTVSGPGSKKSTSSVGEKVASATRSAIVAYAKQFLGNPYVYGGTSLTEGCDCSGFTQQIYKHFGITTGRSSRDQAEKGQDVDIDDIQPGDLLFYSNGNSINHVAMYIGNGQIIHSSTPKSGIKISSYDYRTPVKAVTFLKK